MNYGNGNSINGSAGNLSVLNATSSDIYTLAATGGSLTVTIVAPNVWAGGANPNFNWSQNANWSSGQAPSSSSSNQALSFSGTMGLNNTNDIAGLALSGIFFSSSAGFNINGNGIQIGGPITSMNGGTQTIGLNIQLTGGSQTVTATGNGSSVVLNGVISDGGQGLGLSTAGNGTVVLGGSNTYSGTTNVTSGKLLLTNAAAVQNSTVNVGAPFALNFATGVTSPNLGGLSGVGNVGMSTVTGQAVALNVGGNGQTTTYNGVLTGNGSLVKQGNGTLALTNSETYTGATVISGGVLQLAGVTGFGGTGAGWTLNSSNGTLPGVASDVLTLTDNVGNEARSAFLNQQVPVGAFTASFDYQASGFAQADGVAMVWQNSKSGASALGGTGFGLGYAGITPSAAVEINILGSLTKGTTYAVNGAVPTTYRNSSPVNPGNGDPILVNLSYDGTNTVTERMTDTVTNQTFSTVYTIGNLASTVSGGLAYLGFTGATGGSISAQQISNFSYRVSNILPTSTALSITYGATFDLNGANQTVASLSSTDGMGSQVLLGGGVLSVAGTATTTFDGAISGAGGVAVQGGRLTLTGQNTFTGGATIDHGELIVIGSLASPVAVMSGGTLGGSGGLSGATVNSGGHLAPGDAPSQLMLSGILTLVAGANMDCELHTPMDSSEVYMPTSLLALNGQQFSDFNFTTLPGFGPGTYTLVDAGSFSGSLGANRSGTIDGFQASLALQGNDLVLNVVPEPGTLSLLVVGAAVLLAWRRATMSSGLRLACAPFPTNARRQRVEIYAPDLAYQDQSHPSHDPLLPAHVILSRRATFVR
jgi:autotransporter-associated beta strand protein